MGCGKSKKLAPSLTEEQIKFLQDNTHFKESQIKDWYQGFLAESPDGLLSKKLFIKSYRQFYPNSKKPEKFCSLVFNAFDQNHSGKIEFQEFLLGISINQKGSMNDKLSWAYNLYDEKKNGKVTKKEMLKAITAIYDLMGEKHRKGEHHPKNKVDHIFSLIDFDGDGIISKEEFVKGCLQYTNLRKVLANIGDADADEATTDEKTESTIKVNEGAVTVSVE
ncbi:hypothetical protein SNEBB_010034 [Seison nebaliae]|nr:hypothetical protein SNEBB_010034 [Seison nebaliae]